MDTARVASRAEWLVARKALLAGENEWARRRDALRAERRKLPIVRIEKEYVFERPNGRASLRDLFEGRRRLIVYHFPFDPGWDGDCGSCSHLADGFAGGIVHLPARDISFAAVSRAPIAKIESCKGRMGWTFRWLSSLGSDFNDDFRVTLDEPAGGTGTNGELPGLSVFLRDGDDVFHTYSTYQRGLDVLLGTYNSLDLTPRGRPEEHGRKPASLRRHDRYPPRQARRWNTGGAPE
jgi:predicted dithiol-disulfide oxidoreductase (DUF899 family)